ncbi:signal peptidase I [Candidatus Woesearchaeota archaeon]|nr:signal peptidase I [Candidatus Woesearchaeota archaeon]
MDWKKVKRWLKNTWWFIWEDDSIGSWIVNILLAFLLIKFIVYPGLGLVFGTDFPVVAVVSGSMEHKIVDAGPEKYYLCGELFEQNQRVSFDFYWDTCGDFYSKLNISKDEFSDFSFKNGFNTGDIMILFGTNPEKIEVGDVIVFTTSSRPDPIIHRVVKISGENNKVFQTKGDHNAGINMEVGEANITGDRIIGRASMRVPYLGWIKILAVNFIKGAKELFF